MRRWYSCEVRCGIGGHLVGAFGTVQYGNRDEEKGNFGWLGGLAREVFGLMRGIV
jgi:hypothetical protein